MQKQTSIAGNKLIFIIPLILLAGFPILGLLVSGNLLEPYLEFPPRTLYVIHGPFSLPVFLAGIVIELFLLGILLYCCFSKQRRGTGNVTRRPFPWWGWPALICLVSFWTLAWTRFTWFAELQALTFAPLWISFIFLINAHTCSRTGRCLLLERPGFFLLLFLASALFWWYFEFLNRFVQNWYYIGIDDFSPITYFIHSSIAFATVLPAVFSTMEWLHSFPRLLSCRFQRRLVIANEKAVAWSALIIASATLFGIALWPDYLFPLLWVAPLLVIVSLQVVLGEPTVFAPLKNGEWQVIYLPALAALLCGLCWETWNYYSMSKWIYFIPFVQAGQIFEMPVLDYLGYLPFGLECLVVIDLFSRLASSGNAAAGSYYRTTVTKA